MNGATGPLVFVYGSLKKGFYNHSLFLANSKFLSNAETVAKYPLVTASRYNLVFLLNKPGQGHNVKGEVYEVDDVTLAQLDRLEEVPVLYSKLLITVKTESGSELEAIAYLLEDFKPELLNKPSACEYTSQHHNTFVARPDRKEQNPLAVVVDEVKLSR